MAEDAPPDSDGSRPFPIIRAGAGNDTITIQRQDGLVVIEVPNEVSGATLIQAITQALEQNVITAQSDALADLTRFVGVIDWEAIHTVRDMVAWGQQKGRPTRVGYVVRDSGFGNIIKLISALFANSTHRAFTDREKALAWLKKPHSRK